MSQDPLKNAHPDETSPWEAIAFLWEGKWWLMLGAILGVAAAVLVTRNQTKIYQATCSLEYDPTPPRPLGRDVEDVAAPFVQAWRLTEWYETQNQIIQSRSVAERVVRKLGLHRDPDFMGVPPERRSQWRGVSPEIAAERLRGKLSVLRLPETRLVEIHVRDPDPRRAALLANAVADAYIERTIEVRLESTMRALEFLSSQLETKSKELAEAELALHDFKQRNNTLSISLEDQQNVIVQDLRRYSEALAETRRRRIEVAARLAALRRVNQEDPSEVHARVVDQNEVVQNLRNQLREAEARLAALKTRYGDNWPEVQVARATVERLRSELRKEIEGVIRSVEAEVAELQETEKGLREALDEVQKKGLALNLKEIEYRRLVREHNNKEKLFGLLLERTTETDLTRAMSVSTVNVVDRALEPDRPIRPRVPFNVALGLFLGLFLGAVLAFGRSKMDRSIRDVAEVEALGADVLGVLPRIGADGKHGRYAYRYGSHDAEAEPSPNLDPNERGLVVHTHPSSTVAEHVRAVRTNLTFMALDRPIRALEVTSPNPLEGKTTAAISLAVAFAQTGKRVLLIDADMRRPRVHKAFGLHATERGLSTVLIGETPPDDAVLSTDVPNLWVMPCGPIPPNPAELLHQSRFTDLVDWAREAFDQVVFDAPPVGPVTDPVVLAPQVDGVVLVVKARKTGRDELGSVLRKMRDVGARILGVVFNEAELARRRYGARYRYQYGYRSDEEPPEDGSGNGGNGGTSSGNPRKAATTSQPVVGGPLA